MPAQAWSTQQLAEFLAAISTSQTEAEAALTAVERAAEALDAEVAAIVCGGGVVSSVGFPEGVAPVAELESVAPGATGGELVIPGVGGCPATAVSLEHPPGASLVLARSGPDGLSPEEASLLRGMTRVTSMTMRMLRLLDDERAARAESDSRAAENARLLETLSVRQGQVERLAEEQAALRRVATVVARGVPPDEALSAVAEEVGRLLGADATAMVRFESDGTATQVAAVGVEGDDLPPGSRWTIEPSLAIASVIRTGRPSRVDDYGDASGALAEVLRRQRVQSAVSTPIVIEGRIWGAISVWSRRGPFAAGTEQRMVAFTELVATAISNAEALTEVRRLADEQAALRRVATMVAHERPPEQIFAAVAEEVVRLRRVDDATLVRFEDDGTVTVVACGDKLAAALPVGTNGPAREGSLVAMLRQTGRPCRFDGYGSAQWLLHADVPAMGAEALLREDDVRSAVGTPIVVQGRLWGAMAVLSRREERLPGDTEERLGEFTELVATAIANVVARSELAASRARIVQAGDEQRRRVVRDLHDGAQARLVYTILTLKTACDALERDGEDAAALVDQALQHAEAAMDELRDLAHGILPAVLTHGGLRAGVGAFASRMSIPVEMDISVERLPGPVEATAYFIVAEALTNAAKHSHAHQATVSARLERDALHVEVSDDGVGGARADGTGLVGLSDRLAVLHGSLRVESPPHGGTVIAAFIPVR